MPSLRTGRRAVEMEAHRHSNSSVLDFRVADVLYLLNRGDQLEHPHMITVQYDGAHQPGPTLRDVKARLIALRGKGMSDSFSWSYKRNYKNTFIWCDLFDDDFILPLAESGEYVLKAMELFDASQDCSSGEIDYHSARESLPFRSSRVTGLRKSSRPSTRVERLRKQSDSSMARKNTLVLFGETDDINSDSSMDLSKQMKKPLPNSKRALEARSIDPANASGSPSFEDIVEITKYAEKEGPTARSTASRTERTFAVKRCNSSPHSAYRVSSLQGEDVSNCKELVVDQTPTTIAKNNELLSVFSPSPTRSPRSVPVRRRTWEKENEKITIFADLSDNKSSDDDEHSSPHSEIPVREILQESGAPCSAVPEESFLYLLRKATRLASFRPRLCRGVDVVDSTRTKTSKIHVKSKAKQDGNKIFKSPVNHVRTLFDESARKSAGSFVEFVRKNQIRLPEKTILPSAVAPEKKSKIFSDKPVKEFKTLAEYFESKENNSPVLEFTNEPESVAGSPRHHLMSIAEPDSRPVGTPALATDPQEVDSPRPEPRPFSSDALDVTHQKTTGVIEQISTSRRVGKTGAIRRLSLEISEAEVSPVSQGEAKKIRSESKGNKHEVKVDSRHGVLSDLASKVLEDSSNMLSSKQRRFKVKEPSEGTYTNSEASAGSYRAQAAAKISDEEKTVETTSTAFKCLPLEKINIASLVQRPESGTFEFRTFHSDNKRGVKMATAGSTKDGSAAAETTSERSPCEGANGWPLKELVRPRDFKSREDRLLIPGVTHMDWERSFEEVALLGEPPVDFVLHECLQCRRTFKLDSLKVHMRGCHVINKPKPSFAKQRKRMSI